MAISRRLLFFMLVLSFSFTNSIMFAQPAAPVIISPLSSPPNFFHSGLTFSWHPSAGAANYTVEFSANAGFAPLTGTTNITDTFCLPSLPAAGTYYWRVKANGPGGSSGWTNASFTSVNTVPAAAVLTYPANTATNIPFATLTFTWNPVSGVNYYKVMYATNMWFGPATEVNTLNNYLTVNNLTPGTLYYWRVMSVGGSPWATGTFTTAAATSLSAPVLTSPANNAVDVSANPVFTWNVSPGAAKYYIDVASDINFNTLIKKDSTAGTTYNLTGLTNYNIYYWRVKAGNGVVISDWSLVNSFRTITNVPDEPVLVSPAADAVDVPINPAVFTWQPTGNETVYSIQISTDINFTSTVIYQSTGASTTFSYNGLLKGKKYYWRVNGANKVGTGYWSNVGSFTTIPEPPSAPVLYSPLNGAKNFNRSVYLIWNLVNTATAYRVQISANDNFSNIVLDKNTNLTYITPENIQNNFKYYWRVKSISGGGDGPWSDVWNFTTTTGAPELVYPSNSSIDIPTDSVKMTWKSVPGAKYYIINLHTDSNFVSPLVYNSTFSTEYKANLNKNTKYYWRVKSVGDDGEGEWSAVWNFLTVPFTPGKPVLKLPANSAVGIAINPAIFQWDSISRGISARIQISEREDFSVLKIDSFVNSKTLNVYGLANGKKYFWRVKGINISGDGPWSESWSFASILASPVLLEPIQNAPNVSEATVFKCTPVQNANLYKLEIKIDTNSSTGNTGNIVQNLSVDISPGPDSTIISYSLDLNKSFVKRAKYFWRVQARNSSNGNFSEFSAYRIFRTMLPPPEPVSPENNSYTHKVKSIKISWLTVPDVNYYQLQVSTSPGFSSSNIVLDKNIDSSKYTLENLKNNFRYYWRLRAVSTDLQSPWTGVYNFLNGNPAMTVPVLVTPMNDPENTNFRARKINFEWNNSANAEKYNLQIYEVIRPDSLKIFFEQSLNSQTSTWITLDCEKKYRWRVCASNSDSTTEWTGFYAFSIGACPPDQKPVLYYPKNYSFDLDIYKSTYFDWSIVPNAKRYYFQYKLREQNWPANSYLANNFWSGGGYDLPPRSLFGNCSYEWRACGVNDAGQGPWSDSYSFGTKYDYLAKGPVLLLPADNAFIEKDSTNYIFKWQVRDRSRNDDQWGVFISASDYGYATYSNYFDMSQQTYISGKITRSINFYDNYFGSDRSIEYIWQLYNIKNTLRSEKPFHFTRGRLTVWLPLWALPGNLLFPHQYFKSEKNTITNVVSNDDPNSILSILLKPESGNYDGIFGMNKGIYGIRGYVSSPSITKGISQKVQYKAAVNNTSVFILGDNGDSLVNVSSILSNKNGDIFVSALGGIWKLNNGENHWNLLYQSMDAAQLLPDTSITEISAVCRNFLLQSKNQGRDWIVSKNYSSICDSLSFVRYYKNDNNNYLTVSKIFDRSIGKNTEVYQENNGILRSLNFNGKDSVRKMNSLVVTNDNGFVLATDKGIYKYTGLWQLTSVKGCDVPSIIKLPNGELLAACPGKSIYSFDSVYASEPGIYRSRDNGETWSLISEGIFDSRIKCMSYSQDEQLFAGSANGYLFNSKYRLTNSSPVFVTNISDTVISVGQTLRLTLEGYDENHDKVYFYLINGPDSAVFESIAGRINKFEWTPRESRDYNNIKVIISDGKLFESQMFNIKVLTNRAPNLFTDKSTYEVTETNKLSIDIKYSDPDNDRLTFSVDGNWPDLGAKIDSISGDIKRFTWMPEIGQRGNYALNIKVSDGKAVVSYSVTIVVNKYNRPPQKFALISPEGNSTLDLVYPSKPVTFRWQRAVDPDSTDPITYRFKLNGQSVSIDTLLPYLSGDTISFSIDLMSKLKPSFSYEWYVIAGDGDTTTESINKMTFKTSSKINSVRREDVIPEKFGLSQNYPNPFNPVTSINYQLPVSCYVTLKIYDVLGKEVATLVSENQSAGTYNVTWNAVNVPSGMYFYVIHASASGKDFKDIKKLVLIK